MLGIHQKVSFTIGGQLSTTVITKKRAHVYLVCHFVCYDISHRSLICQAGMLRIHQQVSFSVGDQAPILHCPGSKVGNSNEIQLGKGKRDAKERFKGWQHSGGDIQCKCQVAGPAIAQTHSASNAVEPPLYNCDECGCSGADAATH